MATQTYDPAAVQAKLREIRAQNAGGALPGSTPTTATPAQPRVDPAAVQAKLREIRAQKLNPAPPAPITPAVTAEKPNPLASVMRGAENVGRFWLDATGAGALKGLAKSALGFASVGEKALRTGYDATVGKLTGTKAINAQPLISQGREAVKPEGLAQNIGFGAEQIGEFFVPGGAVSKGAKALEGLTVASKIPRFLRGAVNLADKAALEGGLAAGVTAVQSGGDVQATKEAGLVGAAFPFAGAAIKGVGKIGSAVVEHLASTLSGVPKAAIRHAIENPEAVQKAISLAAQDGDGATQKIYNNAVEAMDSLKQARRDAYAQGLENLQKEATYTKGGKLYIKRVLTPAEAKDLKGYIPGTKIGVPTDLSTGGIKNVFTRTVKEFGAEGGGLRGLDYTNVALDDSHISKLQKLQDRIYQWSDTSPVGINKLRQVVDSYKVGGINLGSSESKFNKVIGDLRTNLSEYLGSRVPQIDAMNSEYKAASKVIDNIRSQLKIGSNDPNTALRKLVNVFNPKSSLYRPVVEQLGEKGGKALMSDIAGLVMSKWTPEGLGKYMTSALGGAGGVAAFVNPAAALSVIPAVTMGSPRVVGGAATAIGKAAQNQSAQAIGSAGLRSAKALITRKVAGQQ